MGKIRKVYIDQGKSGNKVKVIKKALAEIIFGDCGKWFQVLHNLVGHREQLPNFYSRGRRLFRPYINYFSKQIPDDVLASTSNLLGNLLPHKSKY